MAAINRRQFLEAGVGIGSAALLTACQVDGRDTPATERRAAKHPVVPASYAFFGAAEIAFIDAAVARLIPTDALGPGAAEAGVTLFIDAQMVSPYGRATDWYMTGPWADGTDEQGYQLRRTPAELYRAAIAAIDAHCRQAHAQKAFAALGATDQDAVLHGLEQGAIKLQGVAAKTFFDMLWQNTQEGYFADPLYGGNREFIGWKLVGYSGPRYNYMNEIAHYGQPYRLPTVGLMGRDPSRRPT